MKINSKIFETWGKYLVFSLISAIGIIGKSPLDFSGSDWKHAANALWLSIVPVVIAWANPKHNLTMTTAK